MLFFPSPYPVARMLVRLLLLLRSGGGRGRDGGWRGELVLLLGGCGGGGEVEIPLRCFFFLGSCGFVVGVNMGVRIYE